MKRLLALIVALLLMLAAVPVAAAGAAEPARPERPYARIIVKFKPGSATTLGVAALHAKRLRARGDEYGVALGKNPGAQLAALKVDPRVEWAEPDYIMQPLYTSTPNDPHFNESDSWSYSGPPSEVLDHGRSWWERGYGSVNADTVWPYLESYPTQDYGSRANADSVPVAVIDSGFYLTHPDLGANVVAGKDCFATYSSVTGELTTDYDVAPDSPTAPLNSLFVASHGTCVAGEIGAATNNGVGVAGVGYDAVVRGYKVQGIWIEGDASHPPGSSVMLMSAVINAIYQATDDGCKVINMSLGQPNSSTALQNAVNYAHDNGVVVVAATGNDGHNGVWYPAACSYVVGVGSYYVPSNTNPAVAYSRSTFTNYGTGLDVLGPGDMVWGLANPSWDYDGGADVYLPGYYWWFGTSMASPIVAGSIAALWRFVPSLSNDEIADLAIRASHDMGAAGYDTSNGWGAFDMATARQAMVAAYPELAAPAITARPSDPTSATVGSVEWTAVSGYNVSYDVTFDGATGNSASTSYSLGSLSEGSHDVAVTARSDRNWWNATDSSASFSFIVDRTPPPAPEVSVTGLVASWPAPPADVAFIDVRVDGGAATGLAGSATSYDMTGLGLSDGGHTVEVRFLDAARNYSAWGPASFTFLSSNIPPVASFSASPTSGSAPLGVHFDGSASSDSDGSITSYHWTFGDGATGSGSVVDHTYTSAGSYTATLLVGDDSGGTDEHQVQIEVSAPPSTPVPIYRFYRASTGTHFYTADYAEMVRVRDTMATTYHLEGIGYYVNTSNPANSVPLYRFYNRRTGAHLYTADEGEKNTILATLSGTYSLDGIAYYVSHDSGLGVHRFYSPGKGVHFYSADPAEIANVRATLGSVWQYEGPAYYAGQ